MAHRTVCGVRFALLCFPLPLLDDQVLLLNELEHKYKHIDKYTNVRGKVNCDMKVNRIDWNGTEWNAKLSHEKKENSVAVCFFLYAETIQMLNIILMSKSVGDQLNTSDLCMAFSIAIPFRFYELNWTEVNQTDQIQI